MSGSDVSVATTKKRPVAVVRKTGIVIHATAITLIEPADDDKITIYVNGPIGAIDSVDANMTLDGPDGIVTRIGDMVVIRQEGAGKKQKKQKSQSGQKKKRISGGSVNVFI